MLRRAPALAALASAAALLAGCHYARGVGYASSLPPGKPSFEARMPEGYWIWQDGAGWHLRTTSDVPHHFRGEIEALGGEVSALQPVGTAPPAIRQEGSTLEFDYRAAGERGFDWASSSGCSRFELYIDGTTRPLRVFLGREEESPPRVPFAVCG